MIYNKYICNIKQEHTCFITSGTIANRMTYYLTQKISRGGSKCYSRNIYAYSYGVNDIPTYMESTHMCIYCIYIINK